LSAGRENFRSRHAGQRGGFIHLPANSISKLISPDSRKGCVVVCLNLWRDALTSHLPIDFPLAVLGKFSEEDV
jgi:hypothetical protein